MEAILQNGDYVSDGVGGFRRAEGEQELLARVLYRLSVRRGSFPPCPELGSGLFRLGAEKHRAQAARQDIAQALSGEENLHVEDVRVQPAADGTFQVGIRLRHNEKSSDITLTTGGNGR